MNTKVISPRLLNRLRGPGALSATDTIQVLLKFKSTEALDEVAGDAKKIAEVTGVAPGAIRQERVIRSLRYIVLSVEVGAIASLSSNADPLALEMIDEDRIVTAFEADDELGPISALATSPFGLSGAGVRVAVLDTGVDGTHADLAGGIGAARDFSGYGEGDRQGHGTHCAGLVAGRGNVNERHRGLAFGATLLDGKVLGDDGRGRTSAILAGMVWAVEEAKADIVSMSLGVIDESPGPDPLDEAVAMAVESGVIVFAAAGNCGPLGSVLACPLRGPRSIASPGTSPDAITVGALGKSGGVAGFSSRGPTLDGIVKPDVIIAGEEVVSTRATGVAFGHIVDDHYTAASGTSMATPQCGAIGALVLEAAKQRGIRLTPAQVRDLFRAGALPLPNVPANSQGAGTVTAQSVLEAFYRSLGDAGETVDLAVTVTPPGEGITTGVEANVNVTLRNQTDHDLHSVTVRAGGGGVAVRPSIASLAEPLAAATSEQVVLSVLAGAPGTFEFSIEIEYRPEAGSGLLRVSRVETLNAAPASTTVSASNVRTTLDDAVCKLLAAQKPSGLWSGGVFFNAWVNGMYCILHKVIGLDGEPTDALRWLANHRDGRDGQGTPDGTFGIVDIPSIHMLESTVVAQVALEIWGAPRDERVWAFIAKLSAERLASAISNADPFTQLFVALASPYRPDGTLPYYAVGDILAPPAEILAIPSFITPNVTSLFAAWGQDAIAAMAIITTLTLDPDPPALKRILLRKAERQLLRHQMADGSWYCTMLPTFAGVLAFHTLGYAHSHPVMRRALAFMHSLAQPDGYIARFDLPVWDTALTILALRDAGVPANHTKLLAGARYLLESQTMNGGVPFKKENVIYPDTDDTAVAILALHRVSYPDSAARRAFTSRAIDWLLFMQGETGGWAAFEKDQAVKDPGRSPFFKDDPPTADVTGHVLSCLKHFEPNQADRITAAKKAAWPWLQSHQLEEGGWYGRWGMTMTYGTAAVLQAVGDLGEQTNQPFVHAAVRYLIGKQQADGGWGEGYVTYYNVRAEENVASTAEQTAWSLLGLLSVPLTAESRAAVERGVAYLLGRHEPATGFGNSAYTVGALWIYRNTLYSLMWPVWALAKYLEVTAHE